MVDEYKYMKVRRKNQTQHKKLTAIVSRRSQLLEKPPQDRLIGKIIPTADLSKKIRRRWLILSCKSKIAVVQKRARCVWNNWKPSFQQHFFSFTLDAPEQWFPTWSVRLTLKQLDILRGQFGN